MTSSDPLNDFILPMLDIKYRLPAFIESMPIELQEDLEQRFWEWANERRRNYDLCSLIATFFLGMACLAKPHFGGKRDYVYIGAFVNIVAVTTLGSFCLLLWPKRISKWRDIIVAIMCAPLISV